VSAAARTKTCGNIRPLVVAACLFIVSLTSVAWSEAARANPYIVVDAKTERVLYAQEPFKRWYPASLTKLMTAYLTFEDMEAGRLSKNTVITFSAAAAGEPAAKMYFAPGTRVTLDTALKMMLVRSANDAAHAVADNAPGGRSAFINRMNATAKQIGMTDTHFVNANGMDAMNDPQPGQYTTARDMAVLALAIKKQFPDYLDYFTIPGIDADSGEYRNTNLLIDNFNGATGMKTGFTCSSGYNQVSTASRGRKDIIAVALGSASVVARVETAAQLLEAGLNADMRNGPRLATYLPPADADKSVADVTSEVCSPEAAEARAALRDEDGNYILTSPYLHQIPEDFPMVEAKRLPNDTEMASNRLDTLSAVPLPYARPRQ